ncbi:methyltransferase domain-containing protein [Pseudothermotoga thermarum]|uniref:methyltransferase domain-containing protein n=1 Tax=Pseudothermotoga thermarum TaxID=119394 RepID=UPI001FE02B3F|nr:methyltransferase domain-containing protein [Pseudothermotoga thermarum]
MKKPLRGYYTSNEQIFPLKIEKSQNTKNLVIHTGGDDVVTKFLKEQAVFITPYEELLRCADQSSLRILMSPTKLLFDASCFDRVFCFFCFFYLPKYQAIFENANKVLKRWGILHIWDVEIPKKFGNYSFFVVPTLVDTGIELVKMVHITRWKREQDILYLKKIARETGFKVLEEQKFDKVFYLKLTKIADLKKQ